jgi:hypothetical protein
MELLEPLAVVLLWLVTKVGFHIISETVLPD